jgi:hypothetical protein
MYIQLYGDENGAVPSRDVLAQGATEGFKENDLKKARNTMSDRVGTRKTGTGRGWNWFLIQEGVSSQSAAATLADQMIGAILNWARQRDKP